MISHRLGQKAPVRQIREQMKGSDLLSERFESFRQHLADNGLDLEKTQATLGPWLAIDPATEQFIDHPAANALLTREYRPPFVVPRIE